MPITLEQARALSQSRLTNFVIDEFRTSPLLDLLTFDNTVKPQGGKSLAYVYNRVTTPAGAAPREINKEYTPSEAKTTQKIVNLVPFGGSFEIDRVIANDEEQVLNLVEFQIQQKTQSTIALFNDMFINGDSATQTGAFDGLSKALAGSDTEVTAPDTIDLSNSAAIDTNWKAFLDLLRRARARLNGAPGIIAMNSDMFGIFQSVMDRAGINLASKENYGDEVVQWGKALVMAMGDKPGTANPIIDIDGGKTDIYMARLGLDAVHGVSPEGTKLVNTYLPNMKAPGAVKLGEVEMVAAMALKASKAAGVIRGVKIA